MNRISFLTCDVEISNDENIKEIREIISILDKYSINCVFFLLVNQKNFVYIKEIIDELKKEHEIGLHIHWGGKNALYGLNKLEFNILMKELERSMNFISKLGISPLSFRGGGLSCDSRTLLLIKKHNFIYDSSVAPKLNEKGGWYQNHQKVPYIPWYFPSKKHYYKPATTKEEAVEILEIPVTRSIPAGREWFPYTLTPVTPIYRLIINEWLLFCKIKSYPQIITPIFHSWGEHKFKGERFSEFLKKLEEFIKYLKSKNFEFYTFQEIRQDLTNILPYIF